MLPSTPTNLNSLKTTPSNLSVLISLSHLVGASSVELGRGDVTCESIVGERADTGVDGDPQPLELRGDYCIASVEVARG